MTSVHEDFGEHDPEYTPASKLRREVIGALDAIHHPERAILQGQLLDQIHDMAEVAKMQMQKANKLLIEKGSITEAQCDESNLEISYSDVPLDPTFVSNVRQQLAGLIKDIDD